MNRLITLLVVVAVGVGFLGFYRGWFEVSTASTTEKSAVSVTVDKTKFEADKEKAKEKLQDLGQDAKEKTTAAADRVKEGARNP